MRMGILWSLRLFLTLLALATPFAVTNAQFGSDPREAISDGRPVPDNVLLLPLNGHLAKNRMARLLVPSGLWSRQQELTCATNYAMCEGTGYCCPDGNACCAGQFSLGSWAEGMWVMILMAFFY